MTEPTLEFLKNEAGEKEGLADPGIETFRDTPYASCAREAGQNARDAEERPPVTLTFDVIEVRPDDLPAHPKLVSALKACAAAAQQEKEIEFFQNAIAVATRPKIPVLRIADSNTKGLTGPPHMQGTPFHSLLKSTGVSTKESETSGGSFGIGKGASFAVSDLQMVLYSTVYTTAEGDEAFAAQGKIKLASHEESDGSGRRATGYWGNAEGFTAVTDRSKVPSWLRRDQRGTSIFCIGFRETDDWAARMTSSLVTNFFCAVHRGEMAFEVASRLYDVNANSIENLLANVDIRAAADKSGQLQDLQFAEQLYRCLTSAAAIEQMVSIPDLGQLRLRVLIEAGLPRRIAFVRNGMYITDNLKHFGQPLQRFPSSRDFVALVEPVSAEAVKLMKRLENPNHNDFSAERISDPVKRGAAEAAMKKLGKRLRDMIKETTGVGQQDSVVLDELARFFAQAEHSGHGPAGDRDADPEAHVFSPAELKRTRPTVRQTGLGSDGGGAGKQTGDGGTGSGSGDSFGSGSGGRGRQGSAQPLRLRDIRNTIRRNGNTEPYGRRLHFTPDVTGLIALRLEAPGLNDAVELKISASDQGEVNQGRIVLTVTQGERISMNVTFAEPYAGPLNVLATAVSEDGGAE